MKKIDLKWKLVMVYLILVFISWAIMFYQSERCDTQVLSGQVMHCNPSPNTPLNVVFVLMMVLPFGLLASIFPFSEELPSLFIIINIILNSAVLYFIGKFIVSKRKDSQQKLHIT